MKANSVARQGCVRFAPKPVIREVQQDEGPRLRTARSKFLAGGVMVGFLGFV
jgi:hypothetical protein